MPKQTSGLVARKWLEMSDAGETDAQIARSEKKDLRTVRRAIERVRRERDMANVRRDALKESYRRHLDELLDMLHNFNSLVSLPPDELPLLYPGSQQPTEWNLCSCSVICSGTANPEVICPLEDNLIFALLRKHLQGDPLWRHFDTWKAQLGQVVESHLRLSERTKTELKNITGLPITSAGANGNHITTEGAHLIYRFALHQASEGKGVLVQEANFILEDGDEDKVHYVEDGVTWKMGEGTGLYCQLKKAIQGLSGSGEVERLRNSHRKLEEAAQEVKGIIALIRAGWHVPGKCGACDRMKL